MRKESILAHRLRRHGLVSPARDEGEYLALVRRLQPVTPVARDMPGSPPRLMHRCLGDAEPAAQVTGLAMSDEAYALGDSDQAAERLNVAARLFEPEITKSSGMPRPLIPALR